MCKYRETSVCSSLPISAIADKRSSNEAPVYCRVVVREGKVPLAFRGLTGGSDGAIHHGRGDGGD